MSCSPNYIGVERLAQAVLWGTSTGLLKRGRPRATSRGWARRCGLFRLSESILRRWPQSHRAPYPRLAGHSHGSHFCAAGLVRSVQNACRTEEGIARLVYVLFRAWRPSGCAIGTGTGLYVGERARWCGVGASRAPSLSVGVWPG